MKVKNYFLRLFLLAALLLPGITWGQVAKVSEYDFAADTVAYSSIVGNGGTAWSAADVTNGYTTITMPFAMQFGQTSIGRGTTLYVSANGYVTTGDATMTGIVLAPLSTTSGFTNIGANTIYTKVETNKVTVEWRKLKIGNNTVSFQLVLTNTGSIKFNYGPMTLSTTAQVFAGMQSSNTDVYCVSTISNRWDTIVPTYLSLSATRTLSPTVHPYYNVDNNRGLVYTFTQPECAKPNSFGAVPGDFNVIFNWTGNGSRYQIKYNEGADFAPMSQGTLLDNLTGNTTTVTNLPQRTTYYAYIRAFCQTSGSWSAWRAVADDYFTTGCGYEALPMTQNFEADPVCWDFLASSGDANDAVWTENDRLNMRAGDVDNGYANDAYVVLPKFNTNVNLNNYELDLTGYVESTSYGTLTLGYFTNINNLSGFVALTDVDLTNSMQTKVIYLTDLAAIPSGARLALRWSLATSFYDCYIDQIVVKPQPTCFPISNLQVSDILPTSAKFSFTDGHSTSTAYQLVYGAPGFDPDGATPVTITNGGVVNTLEGSTHYEAYVRAICGSEQLAWIGPVDFFTPCPVSCQLTFEMEDSYGDGWNGASIDIYQAGEFLTSITCTDGSSPELDSLTLCGGSQYSLVWTTGSFDGECSMVITHNGTVLYSGGAPSGTFASFRACPTCQDPSNLAFDANNNLLTWNAGDATQWQVKYALAEEATYTTSAVLAAASFSTASFQGSSHYVAYVRSICGANDTNEWIGPFDVFTPCATSCDLTLALTDSYGDGWNGASLSLYQDNALVESYTVSSGSTATYHVVLCGGSTYSFGWNTGSYDNECTMVITHNGSPLYSGGVPSGAFPSFRACPACQDPSNIALGGDGAVTWTAGNTTQWQVRWAEDGSSNYTYAFVTTPSYTSSIWTPNTSYTIDVRSICGANDTLDWHNYSFTMPCVALTISETNPYTENFESYTNTTSSYESAGADVPECWDLVPAIGVVTRAPHVGTQGAINGKGLVMCAGTSNCRPNNYAILPSFVQPVSQLQINFDYKTESASSNWLSIGYITNPADTSTFVALQTLPGVGSTVTAVEYSFAGNTIPAGARIAFRWYRASSYYWINIDNVVVSRVPSCVKPIVTSVTQSTNDASVAWTEINSATTWRVLYGPAGFNPETQGTWMSTTTNPVTITGLSANTSYDVYVRSVCEAGVDSSAWSNAYNFRTSCGTVQALPYAEDFSDYTGLPTYPYYGPAVTPNCWIYYSNGTNTASTTSSSYYGSVGSYNGTSYGSMVSNNPYFCMPIQLTGANVTSSTYLNYGTQRGSVKIAAMPVFEQPLSNLMVSFNYKMSTAYSATAAAAVLELGYITGDDFTTFQSMQSWNAVTTTQTVEMPLDVLAASAPADARLAFRFSGVHNGTGTSSYSTVHCGIDNILVKIIPNCFAPSTSTFQATNVTANSATVSWTDQNSNDPSSWMVKYSATAIDPATEGTATTVASPTINLTGLDAQTTYYVYVGVDCGAFGVSDWSNAFTFTTPCASYSIPFAENFGATLASDPCWRGATGITAEEVFNGSSLTLTTPNWTYASSANSGIEAGHYYKNIYGTSCKSWIITPNIDLTNAPSAQLTFDAVFTGYNSANPASGFTGNSTQAFMVLISTDGGATWPAANAVKWQNTGGQHTLQELCGTSYIAQTVDLSNYIGGTVRIAFYAQSTTSGGDNNLHIDNILVDVIPPCAKPTNVHTTALAYNAATIDWTQNTVLSTESSWDVMFGPSPLDVNNATFTTLNDHVFNVTGLDEQTTYDFYVRASCGTDGITDWSNVFTFTTPCAPLTVSKYDHYVYGFEDVAGTGSSQPINSCWDKGTNSSTAYPYPSTSYVSNNSNPLTPTNSYCLYMYGTATYYSYAVLPEFSNPLNTLQLSLKALRASSTATYGILNVGYMTDPNDVSTFQLVQQVQPEYVASPYPWQNFTVFFDNVTAPAGARMAIMASATGTDYVYVDDIEVMPIPTCRIATNLTSENVYARTANLSWTENSLATPAAWEVRYAPLAASLDNEGVSVEVTGTPALALSNLVPETGYQWKVRGICTPGANFTGDTADWSTVANFTTTATCVVPTLSTPIATANSVTLSWTENTMPVAATQWEVAVGENGFNQNIAGQHFTTSQNTGFVVDGLRHSTAYQVYVRSLCSDEDWSDWSAVANFNTACAPWQYADMPLVQTFSASGLPACWTKAGGTASVSSGRMNIYSTNSMVILPEMGFALDTIEMTFEAANYNGTTERSFQVGYLTDIADTTTFTAVETITLNTNAYNEFNVSFANINNTTARHIAIRGVQTGTTWADFNVRNVQLKLRERVIYLPSDETERNCMVFYLADTVNHEGTYAGNVNMNQTIYPGEPGKVLHLTGTMDCEYGYDYLTIYEGVGTTGNVLYQGTGYDANIDVKSSSYDWVNNGAMTIVFTTDVDNADQFLGFKLLAQCECPVTAPQNDWVVDTNAAFTWVNGRTYTNNVTVANQPDKSWSEEFMEKNLGGCDSVYHTLALTVHPTYTLTARQELCQRESFEFYGETLNTTGNYTRTAQTIYGADSTTTLTLQVRPAPTAYIYVNNNATEGTLEAWCDNADLVMTARATIEGSTFVWDDNSTAAVRTVNPHESATYTVTAYDPTYGCPSLPVVLDVTTTPVPALSISATQDAICAGGSTTLTVTDANNTGCTYIWSNNQTGNSITVSPATTTEYTVTATTPNASACTATATATITVNPLPVVTITPSATEICRYDQLTLTATEVEGYNYTWTNVNNATGNTVNFVPSNTGRYNLTVTDANGCTDEFVSGTVTVRPAYNINDTLSVCEAMLPITWGTQTLSNVNGGDYDQTWNIAYGCDSTVHLYLDVTATGVTNAYRTYCEGTAFTFGQGQYLTNHVADLNVTSLSYVDTTSDVCPVQYNLYLTVNPNKATSFEADDCDSYTWNEVTYTEAGSYNQTLQTVNECDSVVTMNLTLRSSTTGTDVQTVCDQLVWLDGQTYTDNNTTAQYTIQNAAGCDSLVTLNLTVNYANTGIDDIRWCDTRTYTWRNGRTYDMNETDGTVRYLLPGVTNQYGCDSTQILNLVFNLAADTLAWADTSVCDIFILDTVACDGSLVECQISQNGSYQLKTSIGNGRYVVSRFNVTVNQSDYHTTIVRNQCLPYEWRDANNTLIAVINDIYTGADTNISQTFAQAANGCDRTEVLRLTGAKAQTYAYVEDETCLGNSYTFTFGDNSTTVLTPAAAGTETYSLPAEVANVNGCDSTIRLTLTTHPTAEETVEETFCENSFVMGGDSAYHYTYVNSENAAETVELTFANALNGVPYSSTTVANWTTEHGCARTVTINWTVNPNTTSTFDTTVLYTYTWDLNGETYENEGVYTAEAVWGENQYGCDSIITLNLTLHDTVYYEFDTVFCTSYKGPDGEIYREDRSFVTVIENGSYFGTDSVVTTNYIINGGELTDVYVASTDPYTWVNGVEYTANSEAYYNMSTVNGCDSTLMLHFTKIDTIVLCSEVLPYETGLGFDITTAMSNTYSNNNAQGNDTIVTYIINLPTHNIVVDHGCDSYTWDATGLTYTMSGDYAYNYTDNNGCASADTLKLTVYNNTSSSETVTACDTYTWVNNGNTVTKTESGTYYSNYLTADNCPSVDTLYLTVNYNTNSGSTAIACDTYTWNNTDYTATGVYTYEYNATNNCPSVDTLHLTIGHPETIDTAVTACDSYTWAENGTTYTVSTVDSVVYQTFAGCDSTIILTLTVNYNSNSSEVDTACDTYTWVNNGNTITKTESGTYFSSYTNANNCPSVDTLYLTVNHNTNSSEVDTACDTYTWVNHGNTVTETTSGTYYSSYLTAENCPSVDTLYLTVNASETYDTLIVSSEGTYTFTMVANDVTYDTMFSANVPTSFGPLTATFSNVNGCDSVVTYNFLVGTTRNKTEIVVACQEYTWARNNETYVFIDEAERAANNNALYKTINGTYIYEAPIVTISNNNAVDSTFILNLILTQRYFGTADTSFMLSNVTMALGDSVFNFAEQKAAGFNGTVQRTVYHPAVQYCDSAITYNINLIYNYDTANAAICAEQNSYEWGSQLYATLTADTTYTFDTIGTDGWYRTLVVNKAAAITGDTAATACDTYDWYEHTGLTASSNTLTHVFTAANGCDSTVTLNLTINNSNTGDTAATACDTYDWYEHTGLTASSNTLTHVFTNAAGCDSTVTLNLTINSSNTGDTTATACDTFDWYEHIGLTASSDSLTHVFTNAAGCDSTVTLHLTINNNTSHDTTVVACDSYDWHGVRTASGVYYHNYNTLEGCASVDTLHLTINVSNSGTDEITACDSLQWINGVTYFINNYTAQHTVPNVAGCDSVVTLNLTINHATHNVTNITDACDNYVWTTSGQNYVYDANTTYPLTVTHNYVNNNNCPSVDTLFLTLHQSSAETFDTTVCETFTWENNGNSITKTESGTYTSNYINADGCASTDMLYLTINHTSTGSDTIATSNGYYSYNNVLYTADRNGADFFDTVFTLTGYTNVAGCDSTVYLTLLVGTTAIGMENQVVCDHFTWINGHTYEYRDNAPDGALYYDATADEWVYSRPRYTLPDVTSVDGFDTVSVLNLTLTQINYSEQNVTFLLSQQMCYLTDDSNAVYTVNFSGAEAGTFDTVFSFGATSHYCDSIITFHITLLDNYTQIAVEDICATAESYTWDNTNILGGHSSTYDLTTMITDFDHVSTITLTDTVFKGDANNEWVYAKVLTVHPVVYATERRTACDSYTWNGTTFYESTTTATRFFPNGSSYGCDSTVTLNLTIKYNTNTGYTVSGVCDSYTWSLNNETYTTSGDYYRPYTAANGCPSVDTLHLTVNYSTLNVDSLTVCDTYTWHGTQYTTSSDLEYLYTNPAGCPAVDSLYLTVNHNSNSGETTMACDSYEWHGQSYTASGEYFYNYNNPANECPSVDTLHLTINTNNGQTITESVCDTYTWAVDGQTYTTSGVYTYDSTDANGCYALCTLNLTVGYTTNNAETVVACNSYDWNNTTYTTSGTKLHSYTNTDGCPSTDTLYLTINTGTTYGVERITYCGPYTWIVNDSTIGTFTNDIETSTTFTNPRTMCDTVVFLQLVVNPAYVYQESATICETELPYTWRGIEMNAAGDTTYVFHIANNCDSTFNFTLTVNPLINVDLTDAVCFGNDYNANGFVIAAADLTVGTHVFSHTVPSVLTGCDSTTTLTLTVGDIIYNEPVEITACDSYSWNAGDGQTYNYTVSGTYNSTAYANAMGCTSVDVLELTINNNSSTGYTETACDSYSWNGTVYDVTGDYTFDYTDANGCASVDTLHLTVNHNSSTGYTETACDSYTWNGTTYTTSGTYTYNYTTAAGCASVDTLYLTVNYNSNAAQTETACDSYTWNGTTYTISGDYLYSYNATNGCASVDTLHLTINNNSSHGETITACDAYTWHNTTYMVSGDYLYSYNTTDGCASVDTLHLTINNNSSTAYTVTACDSYNWNGQTYTSTGVYTNDYNTATGCASVDTLYLTINYNSNTAYTETACDSYEWNGTVYTTSGDYTYSYNTAAGCASVDTLHLTVNYNSNNGETVTACDSYTWNGTEYTTSGTYYYNYNTATGCASVDTLYLTVKYNNSHARTVIACDEYTWMGETYYTSGDYLYSYEAANGCPSVDTLHLTVNYNTSTLTNVVACDEYEWNGTTYTTGGTYVYDYIAANNCESSDTLVLTINESKATSFTDAACNYYVWNGTAYTESGVYTQTLNADNGCDSVVTMNLTINTQVNTNITETACGSYTWNGAVYATSGTYTQSFHSVAGCDSVVTLALTINPASVTTISEMACGSYTWHGQTYTQSGNYVYSTTAANGCDSTVNLILTVNNSSSSTDVISACESYTWRDGITYTASTNTPTVVFMNAAGCDSVITLHLTINHGTHNGTTATVCSSYDWNGQTYTATGNYIHNYTNNLGCASVDTLHLTVMGNTYVTIDTTVCESMFWHGTEYTTSTNSATYTQPGTGNACDTIFTLNLTVNHGTYSSQTTSACNSYEWHGVTYTESGDYTYTYTNNTGCSSVDTLHLTIHGATNTSVAVTACDSYEWHGQTYTASGLYVYDYNTEGCTSTDTLHLTINNSDNITDSVMACNSYEWNGVTYTTSQFLTGTYTNVYGCDSTVSMALTINYTTYGDDVVVACDEYTWIDGVTYTEDAQGVEYTIANVAGCDSVVTLYLTLNFHTEVEIDTTVSINDMPFIYNGEEYYVTGGDYRIVLPGMNSVGCDSVILLHLVVTTGGQDGIDDVDALSELKLYPNPTRGQVTLTADEVIKVEVLDLVGRTVATFVNTNTFDLSDLVEGVYTLRITLPEGVAVRKVVKK